MDATTSTTQPELFGGASNAPEDADLNAGTPKRTARRYGRLERAGSCDRHTAPQGELLDHARIASEFVRQYAETITAFERRHGHPRGSLVGAVWADVVERSCACKPLRILTILRHALAEATGSLIRRTHRARAVIDSLTGSHGSQRDIADPGAGPLDRLLRDADGARDAVDVWIDEHEPQRRRKGTSTRTRERERAEERALFAACMRSASKFAETAGRMSNATKVAA